MTYSGAIAGVVGGPAMDVAWRILLTGEHPVLAGTGFFNTFGTVYEIVPGFLFGLICCVAVSLIGKNPPKEVEEIFDSAVAAND